MKKEKATSSDNKKSGEPVKLLVLHGPNLNLLGTREPNYYGLATLSDINLALARRAAAVGAELVHAAREQRVRYIILNPAAYTHTSIALRDAMAASGIPFVEVHLSNVHSRETFRHHSYFSDLAVGVITGLGSEGYLLALEYLLSQINAD